MDMDTYKAPEKPGTQSHQRGTNPILRLRVGDVLYDAVTQLARARVTTNLSIQLDGKTFSNLVLATQHLLGNDAFDSGFVLRYWYYASDGGYLRPLLHRNRAGISTKESRTRGIIAMDIKAINDGIQLMRCPGLRASSFDGTLFLQNLEADIVELQARGVSCVVSAVEPHEFIHLGLPKNFNQLLDDAGIKHLLVPVKQNTVLSTGMLPLWQKIIARIEEHLAQHQKIAIHSGADLGRAGYIAAKLLIARGMAALDAIQSVRSAFPYAIASFTQEHELMLNAL